jgi:RimJ/RimL family protein N-acetyltransferase
MKFKIINRDEYSLSNKEILQIAEIIVYPHVLEFEPDYRNQQDIDHIYRELLKSYRDSRQKGKHVSLIAIHQGTPVAFLGIHRQDSPRNNIGEVGLGVHPDFWGKGIGTSLLLEGIRLAEIIGLCRIEAEILSDNKAMRRLAEKTGFTIQQINEKAADMHGELKDTIFYKKTLHKLF